MAPKNQRFWLTTDAVSTVIDAPAEHIYDMVADLTRIGEWSPECAAAEWIDGATGPAVGARFVGHNRTGPRGLIKWSRKGTVRVAERGREFAFATEEGGVEGTIWRYHLEAVDGGTRVTESYTVEKISVVFRIIDVPTNRHRDLIKGMTKTLAQLKAAAEASVTSS